MWIPPFIWPYLWSPPMILSGYDHVLNQNGYDHYTNACDHTKCDHILWSYKDVNEIMGSDHENTWLILSCALVSRLWGLCNETMPGDQNSSFLPAFSTCPSITQLLPFAWQDFAKFAYLSKALYKYIYLKMSIKSNIFFDKS